MHSTRGMQREGLLADKVIQLRASHVWARLIELLALGEDVRQGSSQVLLCLVLSCSQEIKKLSSCVIVAALLHVWWVGS